MVSEKIREILTNAIYLKSHRWSYTQVDGIWGWVDPKSKEHYLEKDALQIQLIRDTSRKRFGPEPLYHD